MKAIPISVESERVILKAPDVAYAVLMQQAIAESIVDLKNWLAWAQEIPSLEACQTRAVLAAKAFNEKTDLPFYIFSKETQKVIGGAGLHRIDWSVPKFEIGYWIRTSCQRQGYATETVRLLTRLAFADLHANRVEIRCDERNERSRTIPQKLNFVLEGILRRERLSPDGQLRNTLVFAKTGEDYQHEKQAGAIDGKNIMKAEKFLGQELSVKIDRCIGSRHPEWNFIYPVNYGYVPDTKAPDGEEIDVYVLGVFEPLQEFTGICTSVIRRMDDQEDKLIVVSKEKVYTDEQILALVEFQERFFKHVLIRSEVLHE